MSSENNLRLANNKAEELTIKQLTKNSPSLAKEHAKQTRALKAAKAQQTKH